MSIKDTPDIQTIEQRLNNLSGFNAKCFELFRQWTAEVKKEMPAWEPEVEHEQEIVEAVRKAYIMAIQQTYEERDHEDMMETLDFYMAACFTTGFVQGSLGATWSIRYLPLCKEYRQMIWMKSIFQYFATFEESSRKVNHLFKAYVQSGFLVKPHEKELSEDDISFSQAVADLEFERNHPEMLSLLYSTMLDYFLKFKNNTKEINPPSVLEVFGASNVTYLLTGKWYRATLEGGPYDEVPNGWTDESLTIPA